MASSSGDRKKKYCNDRIRDTKTWPIKIVPVGKDAPVFWGETIVISKHKIVVDIWILYHPTILENGLSFLTRNPRFCLMVSSVLYSSSLLAEEIFYFHCSAAPADIQFTFSNKDDEDEKKVELSHEVFAWYFTSDSFNRSICTITVDKHACPYAGSSWRGFGCSWSSKRILACHS